MQEEPIDKITKMIQMLCAMLHQSWDYQFDNNMLNAFEDPNYFSAYIIVDGVDALISKIMAQEDIGKLIDKSTGDYVPLCHKMEPLEWLVLLKNYVQGNKHAFDNYKKYIVPNATEQDE